MRGSGDPAGRTLNGVPLTATDKGKKMTRPTLLTALALALAGCSRPAADAPEKVASAVVIAPEPSDSMAVPAEPKAPPPAPAQPPAPPPTFVFAPDLTGQALPRVVAPPVPAKLPDERFGAAPKPRPVPAKYLEPESAPRASYAPPPLLPAKPGATTPTAPPEKVPFSFGTGADDLPAKPVLPVAAVVTERARDVNLPPPAPALGRPLADRVPLDDPTGEVGNAVVVAGTVPVPLGVSGFLKVVVPDPFELGTQVKPSVPPAAEPAVVPVEVSPQRVK